MATKENSIVFWKHLKTAINTLWDKAKTTFATSMQLETTNYRIATIENAIPNIISVSKSAVLERATSQGRAEGVYTDDDVLYCIEQVVSAHNLNENVLHMIYVEPFLQTISSRVWYYTYTKNANVIYEKSLYTIEGYFRWRNITHTWIWTSYNTSIKTISLSDSKNLSRVLETYTDAGFYQVQQGNDNYLLIIAQDGDYYIEQSLYCSMSDLGQYKFRYKTQNSDWTEWEEVRMLIEDDIIPVKGIIFKENENSQTLTYSDIQALKALISSNN